MVRSFGKSSKIYLVGGLVAIFGLFSQKYWVAVLIPIDELIFFRGVQTTNDQPGMDSSNNPIAILDPIPGSKPDPEAPSFFPAADADADADDDVDADVEAVGSSEPWEAAVSRGPSETRQTFGPTKWVSKHMEKCGKNRWENVGKHMGKITGNDGRS